MKTIERLKIYVELVQKNIQASSGELKEFWLRELKKTESKIGKL